MSKHHSLYHATCIIDSTRSFLQTWEPSTRVQPTAIGLLVRVHWEGGRGHNFLWRSSQVCGRAEVVITPTLLTPSAKVLTSAHHHLDSLHWQQYNHRKQHWMAVGGHN